MTLLLTLILAVSPNLQDEDSRPPELKKIEELSAEMAILGQFQKAEITREQAKKILKAIEEVQDELKQVVEDFEDVVDEVTDALKDATDTLARGEELSEEQKARIAEIGQTGQEAKKAADDARASLNGKVREILTKKQISRMGGNPGPKVWGPFRKALENGLAGIRQMSEDDFEFNVGDKLEEQLENISQRFGGLNDEEFEKEHDRIMGILRKVRGLDDTDFNRTKTDYVDSIFNDGKLGEFGEEADSQGGGGNEQAQNKLGVAFFLNPITIRALKRIAEDGPEGEEIPSKDD